VAHSEGRTVADSRASVVRLMVPTDANFMGNVFGGAILAEIDRVAYVTATRHSGLSCVTASFDRVDFLAPVRLGQVVTFDSRITFVGRSSMEVWVGVHAEELTGPPKLRVGDAFVTMVAVGPDGQPTAVRPLVLTNEDERRLFAEGQARMAARRDLRRAGRTHTDGGHVP
jgi:acyl-CoA hydrolase